MRARPSVSRTYRGGQAGAERARIRLAWLVTAGVVAALAYAGLQAALTGAPAGEPRDWLVGIVCAALGVRVVAHAPRTPVGWLLLGVATSAAFTVVLVASPEARLSSWVATWSWTPAYTLLPVIALLLPTGRLLSPRWTPVLVAAVLGTGVLVVGVGWAAWPSPGTFWDDASSGSIDRGWATVLVATGLALSALSGVCSVASLALHWHRCPDRRPMIAWFTVSTALTLVAAGLELAGAPTVWLLGALALPAATVVAVVRYGLFDIGLLVHRSLLYGGLSAMLLVLYSALTVLAARVAPQHAEAAGAVIVVLAALPLHRIMQRGLDRWLHGDRSDPYRTLSQLGRRLTDSLPPDEVLPTVAAHVADALRAPYVAVRLEAAASGRGGVEVGRRRGWPLLVVPLSFRGRTSGELLVEARAPDETYDARERRLLTDLAGNVASAAHAVLLTEELRMARERLVLSREEERRRLRRDLHDGLGPVLAGVRMQLHAAAQYAGHDVTSATRLIESAADDLRASAEELRRVVDGLRPAALDQGLHVALQAHAHRCAGSGFTVDVDVPVDPPPMPAAVEVAAFHVAAEAVANALRHSGGNRCTVSVEYLAGWVRLEVRDDGHGFPARTRDGDGEVGREGVGLVSMRARCAELGGTVEVVRGSPGTRVRALLPLPASSTGTPATAQGQSRPHVVLDPGGTGWPAAERQRGVAEPSADARKTVP